MVVTIVVLLILAGITLVYVLGDNNVFKQAVEAKIQTELGKIEERAQVIYSDKLLKSLSKKVEINEIISQLILEGYTIKSRTVDEGNIKGISLDKENIIIEKNKTTEIKITYLGLVEPSTYYVEEKGKYYKINTNKGLITIDREASTLTKADFENENGEGETNSTLTITSSKPEVAIANVKEGINNIIEVTTFNLEDSTVVTVTYGDFEPLTCTVIVADLEIEESKAFSRKVGVIDIVWLNEDNTVRTKSEGPISPKKFLGNLTAVKFNGTNWVKADVENGKNQDGHNDWYNYVAQTGNEDGRTSNWANAVANFAGEDTEKAYFVWIPRYAYKITYFDTITNANAYREDSNRKEGIIGYSNIKGMVDVSTGIEKLVIGSEPTNVTGKVKTSQYVDYIPHPAFEFDGSKAGIWVGKFESTSSSPRSSYGGGNDTNLEVRIVPGVNSWRLISVSNIFTVCKNVKTTYGLTGNSHMMKSTEWGAIAYLAASKYGRNGKIIAHHNGAGYLTGYGSGNTYATTYVDKSTTGNPYGIYDMSGGSWEFVAGYINNNYEDPYGYYTNLLNAVATNPKYADTYTVGSSDDEGNNYSNAKSIKGDAIYETSYLAKALLGWDNSLCAFPQKTSPILIRGRLLWRFGS